MRPTVSSYDKTCSYCNADMQEIKNSTAPYAKTGSPPTIRYALIAIGAIVTLILVMMATHLYRKNEYD